jgi:hypothetical protein
MAAISHFSVYGCGERVRLGIFTALKKKQILLGTFLNVFGGCLSCVGVRDGCGFELLLLVYTISIR